MQQLQNTFLASQDEFFNVLERRLGDLEKRMADCEALVEAMSRINENLAQRAIILSHRADGPTAWSFDARMPNLYFKSLYEAETHGTVAKRWVGPSCELEGRVLLDRRHQYWVEVSVIDFISAEAESSFALIVDGVRRPWHTTKDRVFTTLIAEAPDETALDFRFEINPETRPQDSDVAFSFERINIRRAG